MERRITVHVLRRRVLAFSHERVDNVPSRLQQALGSGLSQQVQRWLLIPICCIDISAEANEVLNHLHVSLLDGVVKREFSAIIGDVDRGVFT